MNTYSSDQPIDTVKKDLFGRGDYAKKVAKILLSKSIKESYTIGLYSPWGYGKTSLLEMIEEQVGKKALMVRFNPWTYTDQSSMVRGLLVQLASEIASILPEEERERTKFENIIHKSPEVDGIESTSADDLYTVNYLIA